MKFSFGSRALLLLSAIAGGTSKPIQGLLRKSDIPSTGWVTLENRLEFHAASNHDGIPIKQANHRMIEEESVDGIDSYYDEYSQAWRLLGFYIDCNSLENYDGNDEQAYRDLEDYNDVYYDTVCTRYLLWAAVSKLLIIGLLLNKL